MAAAVGSAGSGALALKEVPAPVRAVVGTIAVILDEPVGGDRRRDHVWPPDRAHMARRPSQTCARRGPCWRIVVIPLRPAPGLVFLAAMVCGVVAMLASVLLHASDTRDRVYPGIALLFPLGLLAFACSQSTPASDGGVRRPLRRRRCTGL